MPIPRTSASPVDRTLRWALVGVVLLVAIRGLRVVRDFAYPGDLMHISTVPIYLAREVQHHRPVYRSWDRPPWVLALYGPLLYYVPGVIARFFDPEVETLLKIGRALSLAATGGSCAVLLMMLRRWAKATWSLTLVMTGLFFVSEVQWPVCMEPRADAAETLLILLGLVTYMRGHGATRWLSLPLFVAAFLYKQSAVVAPALIVAYKLICGRAWRGVIYGAASVAAISSVMALLSTATGGRYILNCFTGMKGHVTPGNLLSVWSLEALVSIVLPFCYALHRGWRRVRRPRSPLATRRRNGRLRTIDLPTAAFPILLLWSLMGTVRDGSGCNYFITPLAVACLSAGRQIAVLRRRAIIDGDNSNAAMMSASPGAPRRNPRSAIVLSMIASVVGLMAGLLPSLPAMIAQVSRRAIDQQYRREVIRRIAEKVNAMDGPVLFDEGVLSFYCDRPVMLDLLTFTGMADVGAFDDRPLLDLILSRKVAAFVLRFPLEAGEAPRYQSTARVRQEWVDAMREQTYEATQWGWLYMYARPRNEPPASPDG